VLRFLSLFMAIGGMILIIASKSLILRLFLHPPEAEVSTLFLFALKEMGGFALMLAVMVYFAARDPVRNVAIIDAFTAGLCILAFTPLVSRWMLDIQSIYPGHLIWARSVTRLALGGFAVLPATARDAMEARGRFLKTVMTREREPAEFAGFFVWKGTRRSLRCSLPMHNFRGLPHRCRSPRESWPDHGSSKPGRRSALWSNVRVRAQPARVPSAPIRASAKEPSPLLSATMAVKTSCSFSTMRTSV